jgi:predicted nucleic acid-binding protein
MTKNSFQVSFDTNCINTVLNSNEGTSTFIRKLVTNNQIQILLPGEVLTELLAGTRVDLVSGRLANLLRIWDSIGDERINISKNIRKMIAAELRSRIWFTPSISADLKKRAKIYLNSSLYPTSPELAQIMNTCGEANEDKQYAYDLDQSVSSILELRGISKLAVTEVENYLDNYDTPANLLTWLRDFILKYSRKTGVRPTLEEIRSKSRYRIICVHLAMMELTMLAAGFKNKSRNSVIALFAPNKGNWYDNNIVACSARAKFLVTNDNDLLQKIAFLRTRKLTKLFPIKYRDFIESVE